MPSTRAGALRLQSLQAMISKLKPGSSFRVRWIVRLPMKRREAVSPRRETHVEDRAVVAARCAVFRHACPRANSVRCQGRQGGRHRGEPRDQTGAEGRRAGIDECQLLARVPEPGW